MLFLEEAQLALAVVLCRVHGKIGEIAQFVVLDGIARVQRHADGAAHLEHAPIGRLDHGFAQTPLQLPEPRGRLGLV